MRLLLGVSLLVGLAVATAAASATRVFESHPASATGIVAVDAGGSHTCAITSGGTLRCWGLNEHGQLGDGTFVGRPLPGDVAGLSGVAQVDSGGEHTCALTTAGGVKCWGHNFFGQIGDGSTTDRPIPQNVTGLESGVAAISVGFYHSCALTTTGGVKCWGTNSNGQIGDGTSNNIRTTPTDVVGLSGAAIAIGGGDLHTCALLEDRTMQCWGWNVFGQIGDGTFTDRPLPVTVLGVSDVERFGVGIDHACVLTAASGVRCWGANFYGQIGDGTLTNRPTEVEITLGGTPLAFGMGGGHSCALYSAGMECWGRNQAGEVGDGTSGNLRTTPTAVIGLPAVPSQISSGVGHTCALIGGDVYCWGRNVEGQLGDGTMTDRSTPVLVAGGAKPPTPTATATPTPTRTPTPTPTPKQPFGDTDGDTLANDTDADDDADGCTDLEELGPVPASGGGRNPHVFWDFFDTPNAAGVRDGSITVQDLSRVVSRFGSFQMPPPAKGDAFAQALTPPPPAPAYHAGFDRTQTPGMHTGAPNGAITVSDVLLAVVQFGAHCGV